jgi:hypothetical protein
MSSHSAAGSECLQRFSERRTAGPIHKAYAALDVAGRDRLTEDVRELVAQFQGPTTAKTLAIPGEYLEVVFAR